MSGDRHELTARDAALTALRALPPAEARAVVRTVAGDGAELEILVRELLGALPREAGRTIARETVGPLAGDRRALPNRRRRIAQKARIGTQTLYLHSGEFEDGSIGEIFIRIAKDGESFGALMNCFAIAVSVGLQHGVALETYVDAFTFTKFEPAGVVTEAPAVKMATSPLDYIFRVLGIHYLGRNDLANDIRGIEERKEEWNAAA